MLARKIQRDQRHDTESLKSKRRTPSSTTVLSRIEPSQTRDIWAMEKGRVKWASADQRLSGEKSQRHTGIPTRKDAAFIAAVATAARFKERR